jgi:broad-specificity NMP kinase
MELCSVESLVRMLADVCTGLIAVDGYQGVGKSWIAREIATRLRIPCVHLDDFLTRNQGAFLKCLQYEQLALAIRQRPVVVEGVCILAALERLAVTADVIVYIRARN